MLNSGLVKSRGDGYLAQSLLEYEQLRALWREDPVLYAQQRLGMNPTRQQKQLLQSVADNGSRVSVRAGHGVGKTAATAAAILWHLECFDYCRIPCTAPTASQLFVVLWAELAKWIRRSDEESQRSQLEPAFWLSNLFRIVQDRVFDLGAANEWFAVARTAKKENPDALQGFHATDLMITEDDRAVQRSDAGGAIFYVLEEACVDDQTDILTENGWKRFENLLPIDRVLTMDPETGIAYYVLPSKYYKYDYDGELIEVDTRGLNFAVTPNHNIFWGHKTTNGHRREYIEQWKLTKASDVLYNLENGRRALFERRFEWIGKHQDCFELPAWRNRPTRSFPMDIWVEFLGWFLSEGSCAQRHENGRCYSVTIAQTKPDNLVKIAACITRLGFDPKLVPGGIRINDVQLAEYLRDEKKSHEKRVPRWLFNLTPELISKFLEAYACGDGYEKSVGKTIIYTTSPGMADDLQECFLKAGYYAAISLSEEAGNVFDFGDHIAISEYDKYAVTVLVSDRVSARDHHVSTIPYKGMVYCVEVPDTHLMYIRRNGQSHWTGNSGIPDEIIEVIEGALSSRRSRLLMVGNPVRNTGFFARSHHQDRQFFTTLHFSCSDSPLPDPGYREQLEKKYGVGSNVVRVRADGEFPKQDDDVLIPLELAEAALLRDPITTDLKGGILGVDVARFGDDRTCLLLRKGGQIGLIEVYARQDTMETVGRIMHVIEKYEPQRVYVDVDGLGGGVVDRLKELGQPVRGVHALETGTLPSKAKSRFESRAQTPRFGKQEAIPRAMKDFCWVQMLDWFHDEPSLAGCDHDHAEDLVGECTTVCYSFDSNGRLKVESKDDMKKRGLRSCDLADALALTFAPDRSNVWERLIP